LGAWVNLNHSHRILDIGTGTGLIALMMAQRCNDCNITAIDIDSEAVSQANENIQASPWKEKVVAIQQDIRSFHPDDYFDTIVSNPPYFINSLKSSDTQRNTARHTDTLSAEELMQKTADLLTENGYFSIILPTEQIEELILISERVGLYPSRRTHVITRPGLMPKRTLMEFCKRKTSFLTDELVIELDRHVYSKEYIALTRDFYLKM
jgi:tRNA1Val (adenine37-N6)-methyltransferase